MTDVRPITPVFFQTMGIPRREGRDIADTDLADSPAVAVISEGLAKRYLPGRSPIGGRASREHRRPAAAYRVVGVVGDVSSSLDTDAGRRLSPPHPSRHRIMTFIRPHRGDPLSPARYPAAAVRGLDAGLAARHVRPMTASSTRPWRVPRVIQPPLLAPFR